MDSQEEILLFSAASILLILALNFESQQKIPKSLFFMLIGLDDAGLPGG